MKVIDLEQGTPEWLEWREGGIGASEAPTIIGKNPYQTPYDLFQVKAGFKSAPDLSRNPNVIRGNREEEGNRSRIEEKHGIVLLPLCIEHSSIPWLRASLDGISSKDGRLVELKAPSKRVYEEIAKNGWGSRSVIMYGTQVQHQLLASGQEDGLLVFSYKGHDLEFPIRAKAGFQDKLLRAEEYFWNACQKREGIYPDPAKDVVSLEGNDRFIQAAMCYRTVVDKATVLNKELAKLKAEQKIYEEQMAALAGNVDKATGQGVKMTRSTVKGRVNYKSILDSIIEKHPKLENDFNFEDYRSDSFTRTVFNIIEEKEE